MKGLNLATVFAKGTVMGLLALSASACMEDEPHAVHSVHAKSELEVRNTGILLQTSTQAGLVQSVRYVITNKQTNEVITHEVQVMPDMVIPGGIPDLNNRPLDENSRHRFTDHFQVLPAGDYQVSVLPLGANGASLDETCSGSSRDSVVVQEGKTTEIVLLIQCEGKDPGAVDTLVGINHAPTITDIVFERVGTDPNRNDSAKFTCSNTLRFCASAKDTDNDALTFIVDHPAECNLAPGANPAYPPATPGAPLTQCFELTCPESYKGKRVDFSVHALDMAWRDGQVVSMEAVLRDRGINKPSRGSLELFGYFLTEDACKPGDTSGGDCKPLTPDQIPAQRELVFMQDLSRSMEFALAPITAQLEEMIAAVATPVTAPGNAPSCPSIPMPPKVAVTSFIDKPFGIYGVPGKDYVYKEHLAASPLSLRALKSTYESLKAGVGAGPGEAQMEALLAVAQNTSRLGLANIVPALGRYAIMFTNSDYQQAGDCPWETTPVCSIPNNLDGVVDLQEDFPELEDVATRLVARELWPIFVIVQGNGNSEAPTPDLSPVKQRYLDFLADHENLKGAVVDFDPGSDRLANVISAAINSISQ